MNPAVEMESTSERWTALGRALDHQPKTDWYLALWLSAAAFVAGLLTGAVIVDRQSNGNERTGIRTGCTEDEWLRPMEGYTDGLRWECVHRDLVPSGDQAVVYAP